MTALIASKDCFVFDAIVNTGCNWVKVDIDSFVTPYGILLANPQSLMNYLLRLKEDIFSKDFDVAKHFSGRIIETYRDLLITWDKEVVVIDNHAVEPVEFASGVEKGVQMKTMRPPLTKDFKVLDIHLDPEIATGINHVITASELSIDNILRAHRKVANSVIMSPCVLWDKEIDELKPEVTFRVPFNHMFKAFERHSTNDKPIQSAQNSYADSPRTGRGWANSRSEGFRPYDIAPRF